MTDDPSAVTSVTAPRLTLAGARQVATAALEAAAGLGVSVVVCVCDPAGDPIVTMRMDGAFKFSFPVAVKKAWSAAAAGVPTSALATQFLGDPALLHGLAPKVDELIAVGGGAPVLVDGRVAGAVGISGATEEQDQHLADAAARSLH
jgi:glc operon protein GlcG